MLTQEIAAMTGAPVYYDSDSSTDIDLLRNLALGGRRPNLLILCRRGTTPGVAEFITSLGRAPFHVCQLPGRLILPMGSTGTLLLHDVATLARDQQFALYDWLSERRGTMQVISLTERPLDTLVQDGDFFEGLYYRLNMFRLVLRRTRHNGVTPFQPRA
jgi:sigma-54-interacting transcriptional regulator